MAKAAPAVPVTVPRERIADFGDFEVTRHPASGEFEVWSPAARVAIFADEARAIAYAKARADA
jgi:hypothetical protein